MNKPFWDRPNKNVARQMAQPGYMVASSLWLPGVDCLDITNACEKYLLDPGGTHYLIEREPSVAARIEEKVKQLPVKFKLYVGDLKDFVADVPLEYVHLDFCGSMDQDIARYIASMRIAPRAEVNFTFTYAIRNQLFIKRCRNQFRVQPELGRVYAEEWHNLNRQIPNIALHCSILRCLLRDYTFLEKRPFFYRDVVQSMVLYRFWNFDKTTNKVYPDLLEIVDPGYKEKIEMAAKTAEARSEAARKANAVRSPQQRQEIARKGKETRERNALAKKRSAAANKAWATRRAKAATPNA